MFIKYFEFINNFKKIRIMFMICMRCRFNIFKVFFDLKKEIFDINNLYY